MCKIISIMAIIIMFNEPKTITCYNETVGFVKQDSVYSIRKYQGKNYFISKDTTILMSVPKNWIWKVE